MRSLNAIAVARIENVAGNKSLPPDMARHVQSELRKIIERDFTLENGKTVAERKIGKRLGISQPQLNAIKNWKDGPANVGIGALLALSNYTHMSIDALLGRELPLPWEQRQQQLDQIVAKSEELLSMIEPIVPFSPNSKIGKLREEIRRIGAAARHQKAMDERVKRVNELAVPSRRKVS